jgi:3-deoxy-manno-octulosonate cytidylyltransferase (CMP-KDO synthetase)
LRLIGGLPLIVRVWQRIAAMRIADDVVVATDSDEVAGAVIAAGGRAVLTRSDHPSGTDRVAEVAALPEFLGHATIVNVQGDEPFISEAAIRGAVSMVCDARFALGTAAVRSQAEILSQPNVVKVVCADDGRALYFSRGPIPFLRDEADAPALERLVRQHVGIYVYARPALAEWVALAPHPMERVERLEQLRPLAAGLAMGVATIDEPLLGGVDTEDDLTRANALWDDLYAGRT